MRAYISFPGNYPKGAPAIVTDTILYNSSTSTKAQALFTWFDSFDHGVLRPDYHRVQIERWLYDELHGHEGCVLDVAQDECPRRWLDATGYLTYGLDPGADIFGDLLEMSQLPVLIRPHDLPRYLVDMDVGAIICTEVLEHCAAPLLACEQMYKTLRKGGTLYAAAPFMWPDHATDAYPDYWRFTEQAWRLMLKDFSKVEVTKIEWTDEGEIFYNFIRRFECMGFQEDVSMATGFMVKATK